MFHGLVRPGVSFSDRELAGMFAKRPASPLLTMTDAENHLALAYAYAKIEKLPEAKRAKARLAVEAVAAQREAHIQALGKQQRANRRWPWVLLALTVLCAIGYFASIHDDRYAGNGPCMVTDSNGDKQPCTPAP
jgi:hypothetical protein